jgi:hypothetical protein
MNREQRRHPEKLEQHEQPGHENPKQNAADELTGAERAPDDFSVRAKSRGHKKKTADKWNQ